MKLNDARKLAQDLLKEHGLAQRGWYFDFDRAVRRFGCCHYSSKTITLSEKLTTLNSESRVRQTLLHEVAHALAGHKAHHGATWKAICRSIGGDGQTYYSSANTATPAHKYTGTCPNCSRTIYRNRRGNIACGKCCNRLNGGKYDEQYKIVWG